jgi:hypothetical protein
MKDLGLCRSSYTTEDCELSFEGYIIEFGDNGTVNLQ